uniref:Uncharacterized protein n=1 Tax=Vespula pensylvanica TaxID=30213 RepID=A0A834P0C1_VESPE|nr:hypothetical protein H0235_008681 [Vespula pensylvanica]
MYVHLLSGRSEAAGNFDTRNHLVGKITPWGNASAFAQVAEEKDGGEDTEKVENNCSKKKARKRNTGCIGTPDRKGRSEETPTFDCRNS